MPTGIGMRRFLRRARTSWETAAAVAQVRRLLRSHPASVRVCWDLDNTLVDSGSLLRVGKTLRDAVIEAQPVPNMLAFYEVMRERLPEAEHVIVTARRRSMRPATETWLLEHGVSAGRETVCFVPYAHSKVRLWRQLARDAQLVIIDDLSYGHETEQAGLYTDLVAEATRTAAVFVGCDDIARISRRKSAVNEVGSETIASLGILRELA